MSDELTYQVALTLVEGIGDLLTKQLISYVGSASQVFNETKSKLQKIPRIGESRIKNFQDPELMRRAEKIVDQAIKTGTQLLFYTDPRYPKKLKTIEDSPCLLYYKGNLPLNNQRFVSIVGTRQATSYGKEITDQIVKELSEYGCVVVSGLAYGIDIAAHKSSLKYSVPTIGVMANGMNKIYPEVHLNTAHEMLSSGGLLTENDFDAEPDAPKFPARNRIIAGLSEATIVVEAASKGGALITAEIANSYNREVFAVPGKLNAPYSKGTNQLLRSQKASIYTCASDLQYLLGWEDPNQPFSEQEGLHNETNWELDQEETPIVETLKEAESMALDELSRKSQIPINKLAGCLLNLEFKGIVKPLPGNLYKLNI
jgi:DNA processing protein